MAASAEDDQEPCCSSEMNGPPEPKRSRERRFKIFPILKDDIYSEELPLVEYWVLKLSLPSAIGKVLKLLPVMPPDSNHLKRIKDGRILIQPSSVPLPDNFYTDILNAAGVDIEIGKAMVPKKKPYTRRQFLWAKQRWPTGFHPNKEVEALLDGSFFKETEYLKLISYYVEAEKVGNGGSGCVIVDLDGKIVAKSGVRTITLGHAVMCAVSDLCESHRIGKSDVLQYLGTGFDVFLTDEPCAMCAMALVHFRVGRIFFGKQSKGGVLQSSWRIQEEKSLNHQYKVFRIEETL